MWLVSAEHADHPGNVVAWAVVADRSGGRQEGGELVADTLEDLRAMLPTGLRRGGPSPFWWHNVVEAWDRGGLTQASCWGGLHLTQVSAASIPELDASGAMFHVSKGRRSLLL